MRAPFAVLAWLATTGLAAWAPSPVPPKGSYTSRCEDARMHGSTLRALCRDPSGAPRESSIETLDCRGRDIGVSQAGALVCPGGGRPPIVLYTGTVWRGEWRAINGDVADLGDIGLNDRVRSIELAADAGPWEVCTGIRYSGRCDDLTTSVPDTTTLGMANDVSSLRRAPPPRKK
ncbi:beta/gamma crystallin-related protein [Caulobacter sp. 17J65-9]|uniref:beta/gamma crystallin-related protein n=1 Tax=Caulobacter sp. 17J65-9 TaxID=2709382 RepID=UPI0013C92E82|nr:beta/gamma crystallin-related protein [Caulobacter sp. 17J65-9]NEX92021.1 hypothetical protein [Caulobacter sp. 17J65-9]